MPCSAVITENRNHPYWFDLACEQIHSYEKSSFKVSSILVKKLCHKLFKSPICVF